MIRQRLTHSQSQLDWNTFFITSNLLTAKDQICGKVWVANEKEWVAWFCCVLELSSGVMSKARFSTFFTASEILRIYVARCFKLVAGILLCNFFLFYMQLLSSRSTAQNVDVWFKKHAWELFQNSSVLFDNRFELNNDLKAIVKMTRWNKHQSRTVGQIVKLPSCIVERNFDMLRSFWQKITIYHQIMFGNI